MNSANAICEIMNSTGGRTRLNINRPLIQPLRQFSVRRSLALSIFTFLGFTTLLVFDPESAVAEPESPRRTASPTLHEPTPLDDDAHLYDVQFLGRRKGWAVGDRGVVWHTDDGGENWLLQTSGVDCPLRSICFLTDRVGWIAGGGTVPYTQRSYGVVLATTDGGQTWNTLIAPPAIVSGLLDPDACPSRDKQKAIAQSQLPRLRKIRFFSLEQGLALGETSGSRTTGVYATEDGGKTWRPLTGVASPGWLDAQFLNPDLGVLVGVKNSFGTVIEGAVSLPRFEQAGLRARRAISLDRERNGWVVGDGGLVLQTENDGVVWQQPVQPFPRGIRDTFDFQTVVSRGPKVWLTGNPGSAIWHSADGGRNWEMQRTGQTAPLSKLFFSSDEQGWGVGAFGSIIATTDGGRTWRPIRGEGRRAALLSLYGRRSQAALGLIAEMSAEHGYRSVISIVTRDDEADRGINDAESDDRFHEAVVAAGGSRGETGWQFPLSIPGLDHDFDRLVAELNRRTDRRLDDILSKSIVRQIRTWRPNVLVIDHPESGDPLAKLIGSAVRKAVEQAADSTSFIELADLAALEPWRVSKVFVRMPPGNQGTAVVEPFRYLPHVGETTQVVASRAEAMFLVNDFDQRDSSVLRETYRLLKADDGAAATSGPERNGKKAEIPAAGGLFAGVVLPPGGPARRFLANINDDELESRLKGIQKMRNFAAIVDRLLDDDRRSGQLIAQLSDASRGLSSADAAWQLMHLAERLTQAGQWELAESALIELVDKFPKEPAALRATQHLFLAWGSGEVSWRRLKKSSIEMQRSRNHQQPNLPAVVEQVEARLQNQAARRASTIFNSDDQSPDEIFEQAAPQKIEESRAPAERKIVFRDLERKQRFWRTKAAKLFSELSRRDPSLAAEPQIQFPLASILRQKTNYLQSDEIFRRFAANDGESSWQSAARGELWLNDVSAVPTTPVMRCTFTPTRPNLDGDLTEGCWRGTDWTPLTGRESGLPAAQFSVCYDSENLYFAVRVARSPDFRTDGPFKGKRRRDENLDEFDRIVVSLDVDRDYATCYTISVDQRGCTHDACWRDSSWNPQWFVAIAGDDAEWRAEAAIPFEELAPYIPGRGTAWALGATRIIPGVGIESWTTPSANVRPDTFGLMRFEAPGAVR